MAGAEGEVLILALDEPAVVPVASTRARMESLEVEIVSLTVPRLAESSLAGSASARAQTHNKTPEDIRDFIVSLYGYYLALSMALN